MQSKLLTLCIDTAMGTNHLIECLDSVVIIPSVDKLETILLVSDENDEANEIVQDYVLRYPDVFRIEEYDDTQTFIEQATELAEGKYLRPIGSDCVVEPMDMDALLRFLADCDDDMVVHGCSVIDQATGEKQSYGLPLGIVGRGAAVEYAAKMMNDLPSQSAIFKTQIVKRGGSIKNWGNDYSEFFVCGLMQSNSVGGIDADLCRFSATVNYAFVDENGLEQRLFELIDLLNACANAESCDATTECIAKRIANLALSRLGMWLYDSDCGARDAVYGFMNKLRRANRQVYDFFAEDKWVKRLKFSKLIFSVVCKSYQKKNK